MPAPSDPASLFLFVPADRPERFAKAAAARADAIIIDLEDAVAPAAKDAARSGLKQALAEIAAALPVFLRINGLSTPWHAEDLRVVASLPVAGLVLPKAEDAADLVALRSRIPQSMALIALVETARGLSAVEDLAVAADRIAFGSVDFAADIGCAHERAPLLLARSRIVLAARLAGGPAPVDGVTLAIRDEEDTEEDARYAAALGFGGKLLIHPAQVAPARRGFLPRAEEVAWAERIVGAAADGAARAVDGIMLDAPVLARARQILRAHERSSNG